MLEHSHSPPLPLTVDYIRLDGITKIDEEGILLALEQSDLILLPLAFPVQNLRKLRIADGEFLILGYLVVVFSVDDSRTASGLLLPDNTSSTKSLHYLTPAGFACPILYDLDYTRLPRALSHSIL